MFFIFILPLFKLENHWGLVLIHSEGTKETYIVKACCRFVFRVISKENPGD